MHYIDPLPNHVLLERAVSDGGEATIDDPKTDVRELVERQMEKMKEKKDAVCLGGERESGPQYLLEFGCPMLGQINIGQRFCPILT